MSGRFKGLSNLLVLTALVALGIWGHLHHWQFPRFSNLKDQRSAAGENPRTNQPEQTGVVHAGSPGNGAAEAAIGRGADHPRPEITDPVDALDEPGLPAVRFRSAEAVRKAGIRAEPVQLKELDEYVSANGVVAYDETHLAQLSARVPGIAWRVEKQVGDHVRKGEILAILDSLDVGKAKAEFLEALVAFDLKTQNLKRLEQITSSIPERQIREAQADVREARIRRFNAQQTLINLGLPLSAKFYSGLSDDELTKRIQFLGIPPAIVAELEPDSATANLIPLAAPFDGVVIKREIVTGEVVQTGSTELVIADVSRMWLKLNVKKSDAVRLEIGQEIQFASDGVPGEMECKLTWIGTEVDEKTRTVQVRGETDNPLVGSSAGPAGGQRLLRARTFGTARIRVREERRTVMVPSSAIQWDGARHLVFVPLPDGRSFQPRAVTLGISRDGQTEVVHGINAGESVVATGSYVLKSEVGREQTSARP